MLSKTFTLLQLPAGLLHTGYGKYWADTDMPGPDSPVPPDDPEHPPRPLTPDPPIPQIPTHSARGRYGYDIV